MGMRVIGGIYRHRKLVYPDSNVDIRPTKDRIREAFFSIVGDLENKTFLDLYAGSGSMGIEAISRGAKEAIFVDNNLESLKYVKENIKSLDLFKQTKVLKMNDFEALEKFKVENVKFDVIYLDPPYLKGKYEEAIEYIINNDLIKEGGVIATESNRPIKINPLWNKTIKEYHYGEITVTTFKRKI